MRQTLPCCWPNEPSGATSKAAPSAKTRLRRVVNKSPSTVLARNN